LTLGAKTDLSRAVLTRYPIHAGALTFGHRRYP
jgi:hypothetical protein